MYSCYYFQNMDNNDDFQTVDAKVNVQHHMKVSFIASLFEQRCQYSNNIGAVYLAHPRSLISPL